MLGRRDRVTGLVRSSKHRPSVLGDGGVKDRLQRPRGRSPRDLAMRVGDPIHLAAGQKLVPEIPVVAERRIARGRGQNGGATTKRRRTVLPVEAWSLACALVESCDPGYCNRPRLSPGSSNTCSLWSWANAPRKSGLSRVNPFRPCTTKMGGHLAADGAGSAAWRPLRARSAAILRGVPYSISDES